MSKLEIASLNVRGLQDNNKRKRIFQTFRNLKFDIILLRKRIVLMKTLFFGKKTG